MAKWDGEDRLRGFSGKSRTANDVSAARFPRASLAGSSKRDRAAWFNRKTGAGAVKLAPERPAGSQRVIVKTRVVVHAKVGGGGGAGGMMRHTLYVERDGAGRDGDEVHVFDRDQDRADGAAFVDRCENDRHHFRVIISPERGDEMASLPDYTRDLMREVEADLGTQIDWIAAEHHDTGRPHVHLLIRGVHENGRDLVIPREYVSHTFRHRAEEIATRELGLRRENSLSEQLDRADERAARAERMTHLDELLLERAREHEIRIKDLPEATRDRAPLVQRLNHLEGLGLAERTAPDTWRLDPDLETRLIRLEDARDRERAAARILAHEDRGYEPDRTRALEDSHSTHRAVGRLVGFEPLTHRADGPTLIAIEGVDGKLWTARVSRQDELRGLNGVGRGAIVSMQRAPPDLKPSDRTILAIAGEDGIYSAERHKELIPTDQQKYIDMHVRRLEALRMSGGVERTPDGQFLLPGNYAERVLRLEGRGARESAKVQLLDPHSIQQQARYHGPTWLDQVMTDKVDRTHFARAHFGVEIEQAMQTRLQTLVSLGAGVRQGQSVALYEGWQNQLQRMERALMLQRIERETGRVAHVARDGDRVHGVFVSRIHAAEKSYALLVHDRTATLVPWRPDMDRAINQFMAGQVSGRTTDFKYGKGVEQAVKRDLGRGLDR